MRSFWLAATLVVLSQLLIAQNDKTRLKEGRVIGTTINDQGEPIAKARLCTSIYKIQSGTTECGPQSDEHGQFDIRVPLETNRIFGEKPEGGYWHANKTPDAGVHIALSRQEPVAHVIVNLGASPAHLIVNISDKATGKAVDSSTVRCIVLDDSRPAPIDTTKKNISVPPDVDLLIVVQAPGYKRWFYTDPSNPSQPTLRLHSGEERTLEAELDSN